MWKLCKYLLYRSGFAISGYHSNETPRIRMFLENKLCTRFGTGLYVVSVLQTLTSSWRGLRTDKLHYARDMNEAWIFVRAIRGRNHCSLTHKTGNECDRERANWSQETRLPLNSPGCCVCNVHAPRKLTLQVCFAAISIFLQWARTKYLSALSGLSTRFCAPYIRQKYVVYVVWALLATSLLVRISRTVTSLKFMPVSSQGKRLKCMQKQR
jgi:hypothetical protein